MKLLIITQKVDAEDPVLGFFHRWIEEFAKTADSISVICLEERKHHLPKNVRVYSLGKERFMIHDSRFMILRRVVYTIRFWKHIISKRRECDVVFVHMNQEYVLLGAPFWRLFGKKIGLWYAHGYTPWNLRVAEKLAHIIFTSTKGGCRLASGKIRVVGQGIDTEKFKNQKSKIKNEEGTLRMVTVGRISPSKDYGTLLKAAELLKSKGVPFSLEVIGGIGVPEQQVYLDTLLKEATEQGLSSSVSFVGSLANDRISARLEEADLFISASRTGSLDKTLVEAMAMELPVIACNQAFVEILPVHQNMLLYPEGDFGALTERIEALNLLSPEARVHIGKDLREVVTKGHNVTRLIKNITAAYLQ